MKNLMFSLAFMLIGSFAFANNEVVSNSINKIENQKLKYSFNLGNILDLTNYQINQKITNYYESMVLIDDQTSCTVTLSGSLGAGSTLVSVTVSATAPTCAAAGREARAGLNDQLAALKRVYALVCAWYGSQSGGSGGW